MSAAETAPRRLRARARRAHSTRVLPRRHVDRTSDREYLSLLYERESARDETRHRVADVTHGDQREDREAAAFIPTCDLCLLSRS